MQGDTATEPGRTISRRNPLTGAEVGRVAALDAAGVRDLVERARAAQEAWAERPLKARVRALGRLRRIVADRSREIARVIREETGKPLGEALGEVLIACDEVAWLADNVSDVLGPRRAGTAWLPHRRARVTYEPYGVVAAITPWNYPLVLGMGPVATAVAAGNAVVLKPSEHTPLVGVLIGELATEATGLEDLVGIATGDGATGAALVEASVDRIAFTGSVESGRAVMRAAAESLTPVTLELGGKDPMIVCGDADVERAARGAVWGAFYGCGQVCQSVERVYVVEDVYDAFVQTAVAEARRVRTGDEPEAMIGPLIAPFQLREVERQLQDARDRGARILLGGRAITGVGKGSFFEPTVVVDVDHGMALMRAETFGPVLPIMKVADEEEAVRLANDSRYGLDASVWSRDGARARRLAASLRAGSVLINDHLINNALPDVPFGGVAESGFGRTHGPEGLREFVRPRALVEDRLSLAREPHWFQEAGSAEALATTLLEARHGRGLLRRLGALLRLPRALRG